MSVLDWSQCKDVESIPGKVSGALVLKGTRMPVSLIFDNLESGARVDDIVSWYDGVKKKQIESVIRFVVKSLDKEPQYA